MLFNTQGYKATSISDITDATGLTKGAIYRHFKSKEELEKETLLHLSYIMFDQLRGQIKEQPTAGLKLRAVISSFESYLTDSVLQGGCPLMNAAIEADDAHPALRKAAVKILDVLTDSVAAILQNGIKYKQIKSDIDQQYYSSVIIASLEGAIMMSKLRGNNDDIKHVIKHLETLISEIEL